MKKGVPQGFILGPLLFNIFLNDLPFYFKKYTLYNYADDNSLAFSDPSLKVIQTVYQEAKFKVAINSSRLKMI